MIGTLCRVPANFQYVDNGVILSNLQDDVISNVIYRVQDVGSYLV